MNKYLNFNSLIYRVLFLTLIISIFSTYYFNNPLFRIFGILFGAVSYWWCTKMGSKKELTIFFICISPILPFLFFNIITTSGISAIALLVLISQFCISLYFVRDICRLSLMSFFYIIFLLFSIYNIVINDFGPLEFDLFFAGVGRNGYSAILFSLLVGYCVERVLNKEPVSIILVALGFFVMFPLYGRSSILAAGIIFLAVIFKRFNHHAYIYIILSIAIISLNFNELSSLSELFGGTNFKSGTDSERWDVLNEWLGGLDAFNLIFGVDLAKLNTVVSLDGNPHNSFIRLHYFFGIASFFIIFALFASIIIMIFDRQYFLISIFIAIIFKCFFDIIYLVGDLDFLLYPILFYVFFRNYFKEVSSVKLLENG